MSFPLYVACVLLSHSFILSLFSILSVLTIVWLWNFFPGLVYLVFCVLLASVWLCLFLVWREFFYDIVEDLVHAIDLGFFSLVYFYTWKIWSLHGDLHFLYAPFLCFKMFPHSLLISSLYSELVEFDSLYSAWFVLLVRLSFEFSSCIIGFFF